MIGTGMNNKNAVEYQSVRMQGRHGEGRQSHTWHTTHGTGPTHNHTIPSPPIISIYNDQEMQQGQIYHYQNIYLRVDIVNIKSK